MRLHRNGGRWPCWILLRILPCAIALIERCSMVDIVLKQAHIPTRSPIRIRDQKCWHGRKRWQRIACHPCEPQVASMSIGSVCMLISHIGLVSSSAMSYTNRLFTELDALTWSLFPVLPLNAACMPKCRKPCRVLSCPPWTARGYVEKKRCPRLAFFRFSA